MGSVYIKHEGIEPLGGPVPEDNLEFWKAKGWREATVEEVEQHELEQDDNVQPPPELVDLEAMTKEELIKYGADQDPPVELTMSTSKPDIIQALTGETEEEQ